GWSIIMSLWLVRSDVAALNPALARLVPVTPKESDTLHHLADGNYRLTLGADRFILHGTDWLYEATAASLTRTQSRANREADYRSLIELLPENRRTDLPAVANITRLSDQQLEAADREVLRRVELFVSNESFPRRPPRGLAKLKRAWSRRPQQSSSRAPV